jgi:HECT-domain (ubiquitin-transferase)
LLPFLLLFRNNFEKTTVKRDTLSEAVLDYFQNMNLDKMRASLKIIFVGEPGVDEGGLLTEMFSIFFESVFSGEGDLFVGSGDAVDAGKSALGGTNEGSMIVRSDVVLPSATDTSPQRMLRLRAFGRAMVKALYEGRRMGNRLCPSVFKYLTGTTPSMRDLQMFDPQTARSLQWTLATAGVEEFGIHFESVGEPEKGHVTDSNKAAFVRAKIDWILVKSRQPHLLAIKAGQYLFLSFCSISFFFFLFLF